MLGRSLLGIGVLIMGGVSITVSLEGWSYDSVWLLLLLEGEGTVGATSSLLWGVQMGGGLWMRRGFSLSGRVWDVGSIIGVRGECKGHQLLKLLSIGFRDGIRCS